MNNFNNLLVQNPKVMEELAHNLDWLYQHDPKKYSLMIALMERFKTGESVRLSRDLNKDNPSVTVYLGEYMYKAVFENDEEACKFVDFVKSMKAVSDIKAS